MMQDLPLRQLQQALERFPEKVETVPVDKLVLDSARGNDKRPAYLQIAVPDEVVKGLRGSADRRDLLLLVRVPRDVLERAESPIILPGE